MNDGCNCPPEAGASVCASHSPPRAAACPTNRQIGKAVDAVTVKALLAVPLSEMTSTKYYFCADPHCATVYYSADSSQIFDEFALREKVYQKHPSDENVFVCYCFRHTLGTIRSELRTRGSRPLVDSINQAIQAGKCACDIRNPQGNCCLGNVRAVSKG